VGVGGAGAGRLRVSAMLYLMKPASSCADCGLMQMQWGEKMRWPHSGTRRAEGASGRKRFCRCCIVAA
jgi:hypothetical protein